ncbi:MAG: hypothetical protein KIT25_04425 [Enhydrobacter sp.]|nr:MAG: hypothetical protein KIT25_04425 [Enhydrobacter sp.]
MFVLIAADARAESIAVVLRSYGVLGTWAMNCAERPSELNWHGTYYVLPDGRARLGLDRGGDQPPLEDAVDSAERLTTTTLRIRLRNDHPNYGTSAVAHIDIVAEVSRGRFRTLSSVTSSGVQYIKEGRLTESGTPSPTMRRCGN